MHLQFLGAVGTVTGSCHLLNVRGRNVLVDCGLFQGTREIEARNDDPFAVSPESVDAVVVTHTHIDHVGLLPRLAAEGFSGPVFAPACTAELLPYMLSDAAHIQEQEAKWRNRKLRRAHLPLVKPLYRTKDAEQVAKMVIRKEYYEPFEAVDGLRVTFKDAGHILGSAQVLAECRENGRSVRVLFSGDLGSPDQAIVRDPDPPQEADVVLIESTYGDRDHKSHEDTLEEFRSIFKNAHKNGGNVVIPAFALGRTQQILYRLREMEINGELPASYSIYVDSPLASKLTKVFLNAWSCFDEETLENAKRGNPIVPSNTRFPATASDSQKVNMAPEPKIIISASGMCTAGRILHHLKHNLWRPECDILFVGYQAEGSLGRRIIDGEHLVKIFGEEIRVAARVHTLGGFSAHADRTGLLDWLRPLASGEKPRVYVVHGEPHASESLCAAVNRTLELPARVPEPMQKVSLDPEAKPQEE